MNAVRPTALQLAVRVGHGGHAAAVAADAVAEGELPVGVVLAERLQPSRQVARPRASRRPARPPSDGSAPCRERRRRRRARASPRSGHAWPGPASDTRPCRVSSAGGGIDDLLSSTATDHDTLGAQLLRPAHLRLPDRREGHRRFEVDGVGKVVLVHEGRPGLPGQQAAVAAIRVAQPEDIAAAVEVGLDVHPQLFALDRTAHVEEQARLRAWSCELPPSLPSTGMVRGSKESSEPIGSKSRMMSSLIRPPGLKTNPPTVNPSGFGSCARWLRRRRRLLRRLRLLGCRRRRSAPTGELVCASAEPIANRSTAAATSPVHTNLASASMLYTRSRYHRWCFRPDAVSVTAIVSASPRLPAATAARGCFCEPPRGPQRCSSASRLLFGCYRAGARDCQRRGRISAAARREEHWLCGIRRARTSAEPTPASQRASDIAEFFEGSRSRHPAVTGFTDRACRAARSDRLRDAGAAMLRPERGPEFARRRPNERLPHVVCDCRAWCSEPRSGSASYTFAYARGWAYMTDDPQACANCHVMNEQYDGWIKSSHRSVAVCNDCHVPHSLRRQVCDERQQRLLALVLLHDWQFSRANPGVAGKPGDRGGELPPLPRAGRRRDGDARTRRIARHLVYPLSRVRGPYGTSRDQRCRFAEVNRVRPETKRNARVESQCGPDRGGRDGGWRRGDRGTPRQHHGAEGGSAEFVLPRRRAD